MRRGYMIGIVFILIGLSWIIGTWIRNKTPSFKQEYLRLHVTYNSLTHGRSKYVDNSDYYPRHILTGQTRSGKYYRCVVSEEFWKLTYENSHIDIPLERCELIKE